MKIYEDLTKLQVNCEEPRASISWMFPKKVLKIAIRLPMSIFKYPPNGYAYRLGDRS